MHKVFKNKAQGYSTPLKDQRRRHRVEFAPYMGQIPPSGGATGWNLPHISYSLKDPSVLNFNIKVAIFTRFTRIFFLLRTNFSLAPSKMMLVPPLLTMRFHVPAELLLAISDFLKTRSVLVSVRTVSVIRLYSIEQIRYGKNFEYK